MVKGEKLRVLVLGDSRSFHIERYLPELRRQNCEALLASLEPGPIEYFQLKWRGPVRQLHYRIAVGEVRELLGRYQPDVVDAHYVSGYGYLAAIALKNSSMPLVVQAWGSDILIVPKKTFLHRRKAVQALKRADAVVADSQYLLDEAAKLATLKKTLVEVWGIEKRYLEWHKKDYSLSGPLKVIVPRPHESVYNNSLILKALYPLLNQNKITLTIPEFGALVDEFKSEVRALHCPGVNFYKRCEREKFLELMAEHDIYLSAARSDSSPVSLIEAMALGLIPVAANTPGIQEWTDNTGALTFTQDNGYELRKIIEQLASGDSTYSQMREKNLERVRGEGIYENNVAARVGLMKQLVSK